MKKYVNPTKDIFKDWLNDFFRLEELKGYNVYLVGSFIEILTEMFSAENLLEITNIDIYKKYSDKELDNMSDIEIMLLDRALSKPNDIDIVLTGPDDKENIKFILNEGKRIGYEKYNIFVDIVWFENFEFLNLVDGLSYRPEHIPLSSYGTDEFLGPELGMPNPSYVYMTSGVREHAVEIYDGLWKAYQSSVSDKQIHRLKMGYSYPVPIRLN